MEEESDANNIVLMRHGAFSTLWPPHSPADVNQAVFFSRDSTYRVSHPSDCGDRGTVFAVSPRVLNDIVRELDPSIDEHPDQPFGSLDLATAASSGVIASWCNGSSLRDESAGAFVG